MVVYWMMVVEAKLGDALKCVCARGRKMPSNVCSLTPELSSLKDPICSSRPFPVYVRQQRQHSDERGKNEAYLHPLCLACAVVLHWSTNNSAVVPVVDSPWKDVGGRVCFLLRVVGIPFCLKLG